MAFLPYDIDDPAIIQANREGRVTPEQRATFGSKSILITLLFGQLKWLFLDMFVLIFLFGLGLTAINKWVSSEVMKSKLGFSLAAVLVLIAFIIPVWQVFHAWWQWHTLQKELKNNQIASGRGEITWKRKGLAVKLDGIKKTLQHGDFSKLVPGAQYQIYYLPRSRVLLSAEALEPTTPQTVSQGLTEILAQANGFHLDALPENRQGRLAPSQYAAVVKKLFMLLLALTTFVVVIVVFYKVMSDDTVGKIVLALLGLVSFYFLYQLVMMTYDLIRREVRSVEGIGQKKLEISADEDGETRSYYYLIGDEKFSVSSRGYDTLVEGKRYRAYYTPRGKMLVNIEALA